MSSSPAYVLGCHEAGLAVIRSLGAAGVPIVAVWHTEGEMGRHSRHVDLSVRAPHPWSEPDEYVSFLFELVARAGRGLLLPTTDEAVTCVARAKEELESQHTVACSPWSVAESFLDKRFTSELADRLGIGAPVTAAPRSKEEVERLADDISYPCLLKPCSSFLYREAFGVKATPASDPEELLAAWERAAHAGVETLVQEFIPGPETGGVNYNAYLVDGEPVVEFTARKVRLWPPDLGFPTVVVSREVPQVLEPGRRLLQEMGLSGFANVEFKRDERDGRYKLMEVNGRPNMSGLLSMRCGADFPLMTYRHLMLGELPCQSAASSHEPGIYWINEAADLPRAVSRVRTGRSSVRNHLEPYLRPHVSASLSLTDPAPFRASARAKLRSVLSRRDRQGRPDRQRSSAAPPS